MLQYNIILLVAQHCLSSNLYSCSQLNSSRESFLFHDAFNCIVMVKYFNHPQSQQYISSSNATTSLSRSSSSSPSPSLVPWDIGPSSFTPSGLALNSATTRHSHSFRNVFVRSSLIAKQNSLYRRNPFLFHPVKCELPVEVPVYLPRYLFFWPDH